MNLEVGESGIDLSNHLAFFSRHVKPPCLPTLHDEGQLPL